MKRISFLAILILIAGMAISCNKSSSDDDTDKGYIDPLLETQKEVSPDKQYSLADFATSTCSGENCLAIVYQGKLSETEYAGIAVKNGSDNLKIYWEGTTMPATGTLAPCTVVFNGTKTENVSIDVTVTPSTSGTLPIHTIVFGTISPVVTGIKSGDSISAVGI